MPITIDNVTCIYQHGTPFEKEALKELSLVIRDGEKLGIIGATGSGKSTLLYLLNALLRPAKG
ncbi:MAG: ATP-binding cassette domain-containing protein, partial [Syntrophomonas sp.]